MDCQKIMPEYTRAAKKRFPDTENATLKRARFQRLTIQSGERYFYLFCTQDSLEHRRDEIILWADKLARQLCWRIYRTTINAASIDEATERKNALFEHWFPAKP